MGSRTISFKAYPSWEPKPVLLCHLIPCLTEYVKEYFSNNFTTAYSLIRFITATEYKMNSFPGLLMNNEPHLNLYLKSLWKTAFSFLFFSEWFQFESSAFLLLDFCMTTHALPMWFYVQIRIFKTCCDDAYCAQILVGGKPKPTLAVLLTWAVTFLK